jgi:hypothetical protein
MSVKGSYKQRQIMKRKSIGFKIGVMLAALHLCLVMLAFFAATTSRSSTAALAYVWFFILDAPILLLPFSVFNVFGVFAPLIQFGVFGSALWFLIPWLIDMAFTRIFPNGKRLVRAIVIVVAIPIILVGFFNLSSFSAKLMIRRKRPAELKKVLNRASSNFLTEKVIFEDNDWGSVNSINRMNCRPNAGMELIVAMTGGVAFLNESYQEQERLNFAGRRFNTIEPVSVGGSNSCEFLAYRYSEGVYLFDSNGKEIWKFTQPDSLGLHPDGANFGDVDGDGKAEFAVYYIYREGIHLVDGEGKTRWKHPVYALGHLEITDINGDGKAEIIYDNSNNAYGDTEFTMLDAAGNVLTQRKIATKSIEFAITRWPNRESQPYILLTEDSKIRIVDFKGNTIIELDAPGCRPFGQVKALTVKFKKNEPEYLAVKKRLFPDLSVLYVYDYDGKLVYQKTEVVEGGRTLAFAVVPMNETGNEGLLVGSTRNRKPLVLEYSLTR